MSDILELPGQHDLRTRLTIRGVQPPQVTDYTLVLRLRLNSNICPDAVLPAAAAVVEGEPVTDTTNKCPAHSQDLPAIKGRIPGDLAQRERA